VAVHPAQFLELHTKLIVINLALLVPEQRISIYREVQVAKRFEEDEMILVLIDCLAELIHDGWFKMLVTILCHELFIFLVNVNVTIATGQSVTVTKKTCPRCDTPHHFQSKEKYFLAIAKSWSAERLAIPVFSISENHPMLSGD
jgi:phage FluMu protein Com